MSNIEELEEKYNELKEEIEKIKEQIGGARETFSIRSNNILDNYEGLGKDLGQVITGKHDLSSALINTGASILNKHQEDIYSSSTNVFTSNEGAFKKSSSQLLKHLINQS